MNLDQLEQFVRDTIDHIFIAPKEHSPEAVKSVIAYRFQLHRDRLKDEFEYAQILLEIEEASKPLMRREEMTEIRSRW